MFNKLLKIVGIERKMKQVEIDKLFEEFYKSDVGESQMIKDELGEIVRKVLKSGIMQEFNGNSFSLELYPDLVVFINNGNNNIAKCSLDEFVEKMQSKKTKG